MIALGLFALAIIATAMMSHNSGVSEAAGAAAGDAAMAGDGAGCLTALLRSFMAMVLMLAVLGMLGGMLYVAAGGGL